MVGARPLPLIPFKFRHPWSSKYVIAEGGDLDYANDRHQSRGGVPSIMAI